MLPRSILQYFWPALSDYQSWKSFLLSTFEVPFKTGLTVHLFTNYSDSPVFFQWGDRSKYPKSWQRNLWQNQPRYQNTWFLYICENKGVGQLHSNYAADQRLCFCYIDCTIPLLYILYFKALATLYVHSLVCVGPGPEVIKLFSISTQLSMKFQMLIYFEKAKINGIFRFESVKPVIYPANKC